MEYLRPTIHHLKCSLLGFGQKQCCFFVSAKFYWKTIWNTLAHFLALWTMNMTNLDSFDFALYCISGALWFGTGRRLSSNYDTKIFWHIFSRKQKRESGSDLTEKFYFIAFSFLAYCTEIKNWLLQESIIWHSMMTNKKQMEE